jgi:hypothetical protein
MGRAADPTCGLLRKYFGVLNGFKTPAPSRKPLIANLCRTSCAPTTKSMTYARRIFLLSEWRSAVPTNRLLLFFPQTWWVPHAPSRCRQVGNRSSSKWNAWADFDLRKNLVIHLKHSRHFYRYGNPKRYGLINRRALVTLALNLHRE